MLLGQKTKKGLRSLTLVVAKKTPQGGGANATNMIPVPIFGAWQWINNYKNSTQLSNWLQQHGVAINNSFIVNPEARVTYTELTSGDDGKMAIVYIPSGANNESNRQIVTISAADCLSGEYGMIMQNLLKETFNANWIQLNLNQYKLGDSNTFKYLAAFQTQFGFSEINEIGAQIAQDTIQLDGQKDPSESMPHILSLPNGMQLNAGTVITHVLPEVDMSINYHFQID